MAENYRYPRENIKAGIDYLQIQVIKTEFGTPTTTSSTDPVFVNRGQQNPTGTGPGGSYKANLTTTKNVLLKTPGFAKNKAKSDSIISTIILPMPSNISDSNQVTYSDDSLDAVTAEVAGFAGNLMRSGSAQDITNNITSFVSGIGERSDQLKNIYLGQLAASAAQIAGVGNITLNQILARGENQILNPNMELLFNGPTIRNFRFSFKMTPRDEKESADVKNIIRTFKKNMAPKASNQFFLGAPNIFELRYVETDKDTGRAFNHKFLHKFKQCALTDITVNYTGENIYATYADGTPVSIIMDLTFKELEPIYSSDYETSEGKEGVGY
jgi:hypothetical protein